MTGDYPGPEVLQGRDEPVCVCAAPQFVCSGGLGTQRSILLSSAASALLTTMCVGVGGGDGQLVFSPPFCVVSIGRSRREILF